MRGGRKPSAAGPETVGLAGLGPADREAVEHAVRDHCGGTQARQHSALDVGQRNRLPCRLRCSDCDGSLHSNCCGIAKDERWCCIQHVEEEQRLEIRARGERPWRGRETGNVRYLLPAAALRGRERRTAWTALFTNLMKSMRRPKC